MSSVITLLALNFIGTHMETHLDEFVGAWLVWRYGGDKFDFGGKKPELRPLCSDADAIKRLGRSEDAMFIGICGKVRAMVKGLVIDEHGPDGREPDTCAATLTAEWLGVSKLPELQEILKETNRSDRKSGQHPMEVAKLIKTIYANGKWKGERRVSEMVDEVLDAFVARARGEEPVREPVPEMTIGLGDLEMGHKDRDQQPPMMMLVAPAYCDLATMVKLYIVQTHGPARFKQPEIDLDAPGASGAGIQTVFISNDEELALYRYRAKRFGDVIFVGFEDGQFPKSMSVRKMSEHFGIRNARRFDSIGKAMHHIQRNGEEGLRFFELPNIVRAWNQFSEMKSKEIFSRVNWILQAMAESSWEFRALCGPEFEKHGINEPYLGYNLVCVNTEFRSMGAHCRTRLEKNAHVVIQVNPLEGKTVIFLRQRKAERKHGSVVLDADGNPKYDDGFNDEETKVLIRATGRRLLKKEMELEDLKLKKRKKLLKQYDEAMEAGVDLNMPRYEWWYLFFMGGGIFNGSTTKDVQQTDLDLEAIRDAVDGGIEDLVDWKQAKAEAA